MQTNQLYSRYLLKHLLAVLITFFTLISSQNILGQEVRCDERKLNVDKFANCVSDCLVKQSQRADGSDRSGICKEQYCKTQNDNYCTPQEWANFCNTLPGETEFEATRPAYAWNCPDVQGLKGLPVSLKVTSTYKIFRDCPASTDKNGKYIRHSGWRAQFLDSINKDNVLEAKDSSFCLYPVRSSDSTYGIAAKTDTSIQFASSTDGFEFMSPNLSKSFEFKVTNFDKASCVPKVEKAKFKASTSKYLSACKDVELTLNGSKNILKGLSTRLQLTSKDGCENPGLNKYLRNSNWTAQFSVNDNQVADDGSSFCLYLAPGSTNTYYISANAGDKQQFASSEDGLNYMNANIDPKYSFEVSDMSSVCTPVLKATKFKAVAPAYAWQCKDLMVKGSMLKGFAASLLITSATTLNSCVKPSLEEGQYLRHAGWSAQFLSSLNKNNLLEAKDSSFCLYPLPGLTNTYYISARTDNEQKFVSSPDGSKFMNSTLTSDFYFTVIDADKVKAATGKK